MNLADIQHAIDACPAGGTVTLPTAGLPHVVDTSAGVGLVVSKPITICSDRPGTPAVIDYYPKKSGAALNAPLLTDSGLNGSELTVRDITVHGPTDNSGLALGGNNAASCFFSVLANTPLSGMFFERVTVDGLFDSCIERAGGGIVTVADCTLNAWEAPIKFFGSHGETGSLAVERSTLSGFGGKTDSIGVYTHAQMDYAVTSSRFDSFQRFGVYANGTPQATTIGAHTIATSTFNACNFLKAEGGTLPVVTDCTATGVPTGPGSLIAGSAGVRFVNCDMGATYIVADAGVHHVEFLNCRWAPTSIPLTVAGAAGSTWHFTGCTWTLAKGVSGARILTTFPSAAATIQLNDSVITDLGATGPYLIQTTAPVTLDWGRTRIVTPRKPADVLAFVAKATTQIGAPTIVPA